MTAYFALGLYLVLNCSVTAFNKVILHTPCPYLLTASHAVATFIACQLIRLDKPRTALRPQEHFKLLCFSLLYTINIGISNASLGMVTLSVHQSIRATSPVLTVLLANVLPIHMSNSYGLRTYLTLIPIIAGVFLALYGGHYDATPLGLLLTMIGAVLAVAKTIVTNVFLRHSQLSLHPIEMLSILSPYSGAQALLWAIWNGEPVFLLRIMAEKPWITLILLVNAGLAAALNITSFEANKRGGPLAMSVTANVKQVILLVVPLDDHLLGTQVVLGTFLTVGGSIWYGYARFQDEQDQWATRMSTLPNNTGDNI